MLLFFFLKYLIIRNNIIKIIISPKAQPQIIKTNEFESESESEFEFESESESESESELNLKIFQVYLLIFLFKKKN